MGVLELVESQRKEAKRGRGRGVSRERSSTGGGAQGAVEEVLDEVKTKGIFGAFAAVEEQVEQVRHRASEAGEPARPLSSTPSAPIVHGAAGFTPDEHKRLAEIGGAAALAGVFSAGMALYEHEKEVKKKRSSSQAASKPPSTAPSAASRPSSHASVALPARANLTSVSAVTTLPSASPGVRAVPRPLSTPATVPPTPPATPYFSQLTPTQHHLVQHAAAALLLKDRKRGTLHDDFEKAIGGIEHLVERLEESIRIGVHNGKGKRLTKLFGTPLPDVTKHEGIDSFHGADPKGTVHVPEFLDHCITALMQMDVTTEGILRRSGNLRILSEITHALDNSGGDDTVIDLAALDPVTLADLLKRFLASLPHPVLTGHLFELFIACSHIKNVGLRRRALHLVICLMPRVNRDVFEVIAVFLNWLSQFAHITVKDGNQMDLTNIATVMAPTLLRPAHRDPKPAEYPSMIAAFLSLLEEQHILHSVPYELAQVLHLEVPHEQVHREGGSAGLVQHLARLL
ncbi:Rho GTPase activation protein [Rhodotorula diobovata]|uniref:Rho GTPase activation protein n=1 Tax=Rhodotorula diobovata TaxID=5288 RepID=A0A5C5G742_9BASI|nr:Rho GTPase activation protein [Rhodotorula diobovata]